MAQTSCGRESSVACGACVLGPGTRVCSSLLGRFELLSMLLADDRELPAADVIATLATSSVHSVASCVCCLFPANAKFSCALIFC